MHTVTNIKKSSIFSIPFRRLIFSHVKYVSTFSTNLKLLKILRHFISINLSQKYFFPLIFALSRNFERKRARNGLKNEKKLFVSTCLRIKFRRKPFTGKYSQPAAWITTKTTKKQLDVLRFSQMLSISLCWDKDS